MLYATAGSRLFIAVPTWQADPWIEIHGVESLGSAGIEFETAEIFDDSEGEARIIAVRGTQRPVEMQIVMALDDADAGQQQLVTAAREEEESSFRLDFSGGGTREWRGVIAGLSETFNEADFIPRRTLRILVNSGF